MFEAITAKLASPLIKYGLIELALIGLVVGALFYIDGVRRDGFKAGKAETEVQVITNTVIVKEKIQRAEDRGPRTPAAVDERLRAGTF